MSAGKRNRILLSGPGLIGKRHVELLEQSERSDLVAIVAPNHDHNTVFCNDHRVPMFNSMQEALDATEIDGAIIASPNAVHTEQALFCIERGIPVFVEKPLAVTLQEGAMICAAAKKYKVPVLVGHHRTYSSYLSSAKEFIESDIFGDLVAVRGSALFRKPEHYFEEGLWRSQPGGGPILINLIHDIGILRYLCGEIAAVSAYSSSERRKFAVEDTVAVTIIFENGALGTFILSDIAASNRSWEMTSGENKAYPRFSDADCYHFAGTRGSLDFPTMRARYYKPEDAPSWWTPFDMEVLETSGSDPLAKQLAHFEDVIVGKSKPLVSAEDGLANMRVLEAVILASKSGSVVNIDSIPIDIEN